MQPVWQAENKAFRRSQSDGLLTRNQLQQGDLGAAEKAERQQGGAYTRGNMHCEATKVVDSNTEIRARGR